MNPRRRSIPSVVVVLAIILGALAQIDCGLNPPAGLSPQAEAAWRGTRIIKVLDVLRDSAIDANAQTPPLISTENTRKIVAYHLAAIETVKASPAGAMPMVRVGLAELLKQLTGRERELLGPYIDLVLAVLGG